MALLSYFLLFHQGNLKPLQFAIVRHTMGVMEKPQVKGSDCQVKRYRPGLEAEIVSVE